MAASNYNLTFMAAGVIALAIASFLSLLAISRGSGYSSAHLSALILVLAYGVMMFASSFVEEEQNFWYWAGAAWCFTLLLKE